MLVVYNSRMKKRHHFVPQFYLDRFTSQNQHREEIWTYDMETGRVRHSIVKETAFEKHLYSISLPNGERITDLEDLIGEIEDKAAPLFEKLICGENIIGQERSDLSSFFALLYVRTNSFRRQFAESVINFFQQKNYQAASDDEAFANAMRKYEKYAGPLTDEYKKSLREGWLNPGEFNLSVAKGWTLQAIGKHDKLVPIIYKMNWSIISAPENHYFITSDNPLVNAVKGGKYQQFYSGYFANPHTQVTLPLSPKKCWVGHWGNALSKIGEIGSCEVKFANRMRAIYAERFLFTDRYDSGIEALSVKYKNTKPQLTNSDNANTNIFSPVSLRRK